MVSGRSATRSKVVMTTGPDISVSCRAMTAALRFFVLIEVLGLAATPLAAVVFARLPGRGLAFAKPLGLLLVTWLVWMLGSLRLVPQTTVHVDRRGVAAGGRRRRSCWWRWRAGDPAPARGCGRRAWRSSRSR